MANATVGAGAEASAAFELVLPGGAGLRGEWIAALCVCWGHSGLGSRLLSACEVDPSGSVIYRFSEPSDSNGLGPVLAIDANLFRDILDWFSAE